MWSFALILSILVCQNLAYGTDDGLRLSERAYMENKGDLASARSFARFLRGAGQMERLYEVVYFHLTRVHPQYPQSFQDFKIWIENNESDSVLIIEDPLLAAVLEKKIREGDPETLLWFGLPLATDTPETFSQWRYASKKRGARILGRKNTLSALTLIQPRSGHRPRIEQIYRQRDLSPLSYARNPDLTEDISFLFYLWHDIREIGSFESFVMAAPSSRFIATRLVQAAHLAVLFPPRVLMGCSRKL